MLSQEEYVKQAARRAISEINTDHLEILYMECRTELVKRLMRNKELEK